ncbi:MAG: ABC transporter permease [Defluviitaleaceae bacterium]|nr:ABC transporter permease [Defluviitaleaceae bacterium]
MKEILYTFLIRLPREGFRSLTVPALALVLVVLIGIMSGARIRMIDELDDVINNFPVRAELSDPITSEVDGIDIDIEYILLFTDESVPRSVAEYVKDVELNRRLEIVENLPLPVGEWVGITSVEADDRLNPMTGAYIDFFPGWDEGVFRTDEAVAVVSAALYGTLEANHPMITLSLENIVYKETVKDGELITEVDGIFETDVDLRVVGIVHNAGSLIISPFWTVNAVAAEIYLPEYSNRMNALMYDNGKIGELASAAVRVFARPGDVNTTLSFSLTIFDGIYNNVIRKLKQNIQLIDVATPFIYAISVLIGFIASYLLTRNRKPEFAVMRSIGVNKRDVFTGALGEQAVLCIPGAVTGFILVSVFFRQVLWVPPVLFTFCYVLGSVFAAAQAAGTNVLKILRENNE